MTFDNEEQREQLLQIITGVQVQGPLEQARKAIEQVDALVEAIKGAKVVEAEIPVEE